MAIGKFGQGRHGRADAGIDNGGGAVQGDGQGRVGNILTGGAVVKVAGGIGRCPGP